MSADAERALAEKLSLIETIEEAQDQLLLLAGWQPGKQGVTWVDATGNGAPFTRAHALSIVTGETRDERDRLAARAA